MRLIECEQGTQEWLAARVGVITASRFKDACDRLADKPEKKDKDGNIVSALVRGAPSAKAKLYAADVALERTTKVAVLGPYVNQEMRIGTEREPYARSLYENQFDAWVRESGIALTDDGLFGYSTDGFVDDDGCIEIKCPSSAETIISMWRTHDLSAYMHQIQGGLWLTGRKWCDFIMYVPALRPLDKHLYVRRITRDEAFIEAMETDLMEFKELVEANEAALLASVKTEGGRVIP